LRLGRRITSLSPDEVRNGMEWALAREWLAPQLAPLFQDVLLRLVMGSEDSELR
jgi:hypothetical protein